MKFQSPEHTPQSTDPTDAAPNGTIPSGEPPLRGADRPRGRAAPEGEPELTLRGAGRRWQVFPLERTFHRREELRAEVLVAREGPAPAASYLDTCNLSSQHSRARFVRRAASKLEADPDALERELDQLVSPLLAQREAQLEARQRAERGGAPSDPGGSANGEPPATALGGPQRAEAEAFLCDPNLQTQLEDDLALCGFTGLEAVAAYLAATSRLLKEPLAVVVPADSLAGKRSLLDLVHRFMPGEDVMSCDFPTPRSLADIEKRARQHKILTIAEPANASPRQRRTMEPLLPRRQLAAYASERDPDTGQRATEPNSVQGATALFLVTPNIGPDDEQVRRRSLFLGGGAGRHPAPLARRPYGGRQTEAELRRRARAKARQAIHRNAQRLLEPLTVLHADVTEPAFSGPPSRRAFQRAQYWNWVSASALLNQRRRVRKTVVEGSETFDCIEADVEDQALAYRLAEHLFDRSDGLAPRPRELLDLLRQAVRTTASVRGIERAQVGFTGRGVEALTGWGTTQVKYYLNRLCKLEYLRTISRTRGNRPFVYVINDEDVGIAPAYSVQVGLVRPIEPAAATPSEPAGLNLRGTFERP